MCAWAAVAARFAPGDSHAATEADRSRRRQLLLSALFVAGCGFRSIFPGSEGERICLYDGWVSSALVTRSVATVAELCFIGQWSLLLADAGRTAPVPAVATIARFPLPLIATAEVFSWYTALTTN